jgi:hypothetical protein
VACKNQIKVFITETIFFMHSTILTSYRSQYIHDLILVLHPSLPGVHIGRDPLGYAMFETV